MTTGHLDRKEPLRRAAGLGRETLVRNKRAAARLKDLTEPLLS
jgi:hypothetical protein